MATAKLTYEDMTIDDIIKWCQDNNEVAWLKAKAQEQREYKVYPKKVVIDEKTGKEKRKADKSKPYHIEKRPISYIQIKIDFVDKFMPEIAPERKEKLSMYDRIMAL